MNYVCSVPGTCIQLGEIVVLFSFVLVVFLESIVSDRAAFGSRCSRT